jgi:hypothetical protein
LFSILNLKPGNGVRLARLRQIIKDNGFASKDVSVLASGASEKRASIRDQRDE